MTPLTEVHIHRLDKSLAWWLGGIRRCLCRLQTLDAEMQTLRRATALELWEAGVRELPSGGPSVSMASNSDWESRWFDESQYLANALGQMENHLALLAPSWSGTRATAGLQSRAAFRDARFRSLRDAIEHMAEHRAQSERPQVSWLSPDDDDGPRFELDCGWPVEFSMFGLTYPASAVCDAAVEVGGAWGDRQAWPARRPPAFHEIEWPPPEADSARVRPPL